MAKVYKGIRIDEDLAAAVAAARVGDETESDVYRRLIKAGLKVGGADARIVSTASSGGEMKLTIKDMRNRASVPVATYEGRMAKLIWETCARNNSGLFNADGYCGGEITQSDGIRYIEDVVDSSEFCSCADEMPLLNNVNWRRVLHSDEVGLDWEGACVEEVNNGLAIDTIDELDYASLDCSTSMLQALLEALPELYISNLPDRRLAFGVMIGWVANIETDAKAVSQALGTGADVWGGRAVPSDDEHLYVHIRHDKMLVWRDQASLDWERLFGSSWVA